MFSRSPTSRTSSLKSSRSGSTKRKASAEGFVPRVLEEVLPGRTDVDLTLRATGGLTGRVVLEDGSVPEAFLIVTHIEAESSTASPERYAGFPRKESFASEDGAQPREYRAIYAADKTSGIAQP